MSSLSLATLSKTLFAHKSLYVLMCSHLLLTNTVHTSGMRVWKLEASQNEERHPSRWGYALAESADEALVLCKATSSLPFNYVLEKHPAMIWPGVPGEQVCWS